MNEDHLQSLPYMNMLDGDVSQHNQHLFRNHMDFYIVHLRKLHDQHIHCHSNIRVLLEVESFYILHCCLERSYRHKSKSLFLLAVNREHHTWLMLHMAKVQYKDFCKRY